MRKSLMNKLPFFAAVALGALGLQGCYVDSNHYDCYWASSCTPVRVQHCDTVPDMWGGLWEECWYDVDEVCSSYEVCEETPECYTDRDCRGGKTCSNGNCVAVQSGSSGLCSACNGALDCRESGALCIALDTGEQVCGRSCKSDNDCPANYECDAFMDGNRSVGQCAPKIGSCVSNYCRDNRDCAENATCDNNVCVLAKENLNECSTYKDCKGYTTLDGEAELNVCVKSTDKKTGNSISYCTIDCYSDEGCDPGYTCHLENNSLESGVCYRGDDHGCVKDSQCGSGMVCSNGRCAVSCRNDADCSSPSNAFACINRVCVFKL